MRNSARRAPAVGVCRFNGAFARSGDGRQAQVQSVHGRLGTDPETWATGRGPRGQCRWPPLFSSLAAGDLDLLLCCFDAGLRDGCLDVQDTVLVHSSDVPLLHTLGQGDAPVHGSIAEFRAITALIPLFGPHLAFGPGSAADPRSGKSPRPSPGNARQSGPTVRTLSLIPCSTRLRRGGTAARRPVIAVRRQRPRVSGHCFTVERHPRQNPSFTPFNDGGHQEAGLPTAGTQ